MTTQRFHIHFKSDPPPPVLNLWLATAINSHLFFILSVVCLFVNPLVKFILKTSVWSWERLALAGSHFPVIRRQDKHSELTRRHTAASALLTTCSPLMWLWGCTETFASFPLLSRCSEGAIQTTRKISITQKALLSINTSVKTHKESAVSSNCVD